VHKSLRTRANSLTHVARRSAEYPNGNKDFRGYLVTQKPRFGYTPLTRFEVFNDPGAEEPGPARATQAAEERSEVVTNRVMADGAEVMAETRTEISSVFYLGRGSLRMETIVADAPANDDGAPREITGVVTSPYRERADESSVILDVGADAATLIARAVSGAWRAPEPDALFASQDGVPRLAPPVGSGWVAAKRRGRLVSISRGALLTAGLFAVACGLASGAIARLATRGVPAAHAPVAATTIVPPAPAVPPEPAVVPAPAPSFEAPDERAEPIVAVPTPVVIRAHKKAAARPAPAPARWVDPFAN
jgi:hypothetical protein